MAQYGEDSKTSKDTGATVCKADDDGVLVAVVLELVVGRKGCKPTPGNRERVEDLRCGISPHLEWKKTLSLLRLTVWLQAQKPGHSFSLVTHTLTDCTPAQLIVTLTVSN